MSLNKAQKEAVSHKEGPCLVLAGPGSGKTLTIAKRIEYLIKVYKVRPEEILVITFTKYAAGEMRDRFQYVMEGRRLPVTFGTFHGIFYGILKWAYKLDRSNILSEEEKNQLLKEILKQMDWEQTEKSQEADFLQELSEEIGNVGNNAVDIEFYESRRFPKDKFRELYRIYETEKKKYRKLDFEDMLIWCRKLFLERPDLLAKWQEKYHYVLVDEFQDINQVQYDVIRMLAAPENNLFIVGDDDQSIYGFRGAKPGIMKDFMQDYPEAKRILLDINYRSNAHIVKGALRVIGHNKDRYEKKIQPFREAQETVHVQETLDPLDESKYILKEIQKYMKKGVDLKQMAVLYRIGEDARVLAETFTQYQIPFSMKERIHHLYEHFVCTDMNCYFRLAVGTYDRGDFLEIANRPKRYLSRGCMEETPVTYESLRRFYCDKEWMQDRIDQLEWDMKMIRTKTPYAAIQYIRKSIGYDEFLKEYALGHQMEYSELKEIMDELQERTKEFQTLPEWLAHVEEYKHTLQMQRQQRGNGTGEGVTCLTMHGAKGLEYEVVFVIESNEGVTPYKKAGTPEELEEERRLFYVAMTRAKKKLFITYVKEKNGKSKTPSRFIDELLVTV